MNTLVLALSPERPPQDPGLLRETLVDPLGQAAFLCERYLDTYLREGGAKLKFLIGREGSGKSHFLGYLVSEARDRGFLAQTVSAREMPLFSFHQIYLETMRGVNVKTLVGRYARALVKGLGYSYPEDGGTFVEHAVAQGRDGTVVRRELQDRLAEDLFRDRDMERSFATALVALASGELGIRPLEAEARMTLETWLKGEPVPARERNRLHLRKAVDRYSARLIFRSFLHFLPKAGVSGVLLAIDDFEQVTETRPGAVVRYTRAKRDELYESLRQIIDEVDALRGFFLIVAGRREIIEDQGKGVRSYEALWMRLQNEVRSEKCNRFADLIDLDRLWAQQGTEGLRQVADKVLAVAGVPASARGDILAQADRMDQGGTVSPVRRVIHLALSSLGRFNS